KVVTVSELAEFDHALLLDMRNKTEFSEGHLPGAAQLSAGRALWRTDTLPREGTIVTYCQSGTRNGVAAAALRRAGFDVAELKGSYEAWIAAGNTPVVPDAEAAA